MNGGKSSCVTKKFDTKLAVKKTAAKRKAFKNPRKPKRPPSAFFVFMEDFRRQFKDENPWNRSVAAIGKAGGQKWKGMLESEKAPYEVKAEQMKKEYEKKMASFNKKLEDEAEDDESDKSKSEVNVEEDEEGSEEVMNEEEEEETIVKSIEVVPKTCVHGYKVKETVAPILEAIFKKHGDIAAKCVFKTASVRATFLEIVCEVIQRIQTTYYLTTICSKMEEIEAQIHVAEAANINVSWLRAHLEALKKTSSLMESKAKISLTKQAAETELRCAWIRFQKAERCVKVVGLVEKMLNDNIGEALRESPIL